jgi:hypothetical protein
VVRMKLELSDEETSELIFLMRERLKMIDGNFLLSFHLVKAEKNIISSIVQKMKLERMQEVDNAETLQPDCRT